MEFDYTGSYSQKVHDFVDFSFIVRNVRAVPSYKRLASTTEYRDGVTTKTTYGYDKDKRTLSPKSKSVSIANNNLAQASSSSTTTYTYPFESNDEVAREMTRKNMIVPLKTTNTRNGTVVRTDSVAYSIFGGIQPKEYYTATGNEPLEKRLSYTYDAYGDIIGLTNDAGECTIFIWDHKAHLPIAKIEGATFASLHEVIGEELFQSLFDDRCNTSMLQMVRDILANTPYQMTDYRHTPLVGVNS